MPDPFVGIVVDVFDVPQDDGGRAVLWLRRAGGDVAVGDWVHVGDWSARVVEVGRKMTEDCLTGRPKTDGYEIALRTDGVPELALRGQTVTGRGS